MQAIAGLPSSGKSFVIFQLESANGKAPPSRES
jgi:hypothetical protein